MLTGNSTSTVESPQQQDPIPSAASSSAWAADWPQNKELGYYDNLKEGYEEFISGTELLVVPSVVEVINTRIISHLATDIKSRKLVSAES